MNRPLAAGSVLLATIGVLFASPVAAATKPAASAKSASATAQPPSATVVAMAQWARTSGDNHDLPYIIIDKQAAEVFVYGADGQMLGAAPALLGLAVGDESTPGVGDRELSDIAPEDRTTPAGRFQAAYGPGPGKEKVFWVDYGHGDLAAPGDHHQPQGTPPAAPAIADNGG